jgi:hypothetical protein
VDNIHSCNDLDCNRLWLFSTGIFEARQGLEVARTHGDTLPPAATLNALELAALYTPKSNKHARSLTIF